MARTNVPVTDLQPTKAAYTTALTGTHNDLVYTAKIAGPGGNSIQITYVVSGASTPLTIAVSGFSIVVNVATSGASAATSTSAQVKAAVEANSDAAALVTLAHASANDGTGVVTALSVQSLSGGRLSTAQPTLVNGDATNDHYYTSNSGQEVIEVVSTDGSDQTVTVQFAPAAAGGVQAVSGYAETIPAGTTRIIGPFSKSKYNQNAAGDVHFDPSVSNTLDFRAYRTTKVT